MLIKLASSGRLVGSYETPSSESVTAALIFLSISSLLSTMDILDFGFGSDLDIFFSGFVSDMILFAGANTISIIIDVNPREPLIAEIDRTPQT